MLYRFFRHMALETLDFLFADLRFFNGVMGAISLAQALRLWWPDNALALPGYDVLARYVSENWFALLPFMHFVGVAFRQYTAKFFRGHNWFWRVGQATHVTGALAYGTPVFFVILSIHSVGLQGVAFLFITAAMVWQVFRTDI